MVSTRVASRIISRAEFTAVRLTDVRFWRVTTICFFTESTDVLRYARPSQRCHSLFQYVRHGGEPNKFSIRSSVELKLSCDPFSRECWVLATRLPTSALQTALGLCTVSVPTFDGLLFMVSPFPCLPIIHEDG